jgi:hypothetical protein
MTLSEGNSGKAVVAERQRDLRLGSLIADIQRERPLSTHSGHSAEKRDRLLVAESRPSALDAHKLRAAMR